MMISTSRTILTLFLVVSMFSAGSAQITDTAPDTGFSVPEFESNQEILTQLVAPFIFLFVLMQYTLSRSLHFALDKRGRPKAGKQETLLSLAIVTMLIPSPFWQYVQWGIQTLGVIGLIAFVGLFFFVILVLGGLR